jgi:anti-sigma factor RsiW
MTCAESRLLLDADADGELDLARSLELQRHLETCAACAGAREIGLSLKSALREPAMRYEAPDSLRREVRWMTRTPVAEATPKFFQSLLFWRWLAFGATAFALLVFLLRPGIAGRSEILNEVVASHVRSLMVEHLTDIGSSDQHTVKPWFNGKLDFAPNVKDFAAQGFALVGGRLDYLNSRTVAALVYRHDKHWINVFVWPAANPGGEKMRIENRRGYVLINFEAAGLHHCLVSDLNQKELADLANLLEANQR